MVSTMAKPQTKGFTERLADPKWSAPRIAVTDAPKYIQRDVTLIGEALQMDGHNARFRCIASGVEFTLTGIPTAEWSKVNEITAFNDGGSLVYAAHGMLNDDFNAETYAAMLRVIHTHHQDLFGF